VTRLTIQLPDDLKSRVEARAADAGHASVEQYVEALLRADVDEEVDHGAPEHLTVHSDAEVEAILLRRLESTEPGIEATDEFWARLESEAQARRSAGARR